MMTRGETGRSHSQRRINPADLEAERAAILQRPDSRERRGDLAKVQRRIRNLEYRSER